MLIKKCDYHIFNDDNFCNFVMILTLHKNKF